MNYSNKKSVRLDELAKLRTGIRMTPDLQGDIHCFQITDFDDRGRYTLPTIGKVTGEVADKNLLASGDVVFAAKGSRNFAAVITDLALPSVASTSFFVLRLSDTAHVTPAFLAWYLNHPKTLESLQAQSQSTSIAYISIQQLSDLVLLIPTLEQQQQVLRIDDLSRQEQHLAKNYYLQKHQYIQSVLFKFIQS